MARLMDDVRIAHGNECGNCMRVAAERCGFGSPDSATREVVIPSRKCCAHSGGQASSSSPLDGPPERSGCTGDQGALPKQHEFSIVMQHASRHVCGSEESNANHALHFTARTAPKVKAPLAMTK